MTILVVGGGTYLASELYLANWSKSGTTLVLGQWQQVELTEGENIIYYQSLDSVPRDGVMLRVRDTFNEVSAASLLPIGERTEFKFNMSDIQGRALWNYEAEETGDYQLMARNTNVGDDKDVADDRIVVNKSPGKVEDVLQMRKVILIAGLTVTGVLVVIFYLLHGIKLNSDK